MTGPDTDCTCAVHTLKPHYEPKEGTASFVRGAATQQLINCLNQIGNIASGEGEPTLCWGTEDRSTFSRGQISGLVARALKVIATSAKTNYDLYKNAAAVKVVPGEELKPGDLVRINNDDKIEKAKPGDSRFLGALPPTMMIRDNVLIVPEYWFTLALRKGLGEW